MPRARTNARCAAAVRKLGAISEHASVLRTPAVLRRAGLSECVCAACRAHERTHAALQRAGLSECVCAACRAHERTPAALERAGRVAAVCAALPRVPSNALHCSGPDRVRAFTGRRPWAGRALGRGCSRPGRPLRRTAAERPHPGPPPHAGGGGCRARLPARAGVRSLRMCLAAPRIAAPPSSCGLARPPPRCSLAAPRACGLPARHMWRSAPPPAARAWVGASGDGAPLADPPRGGRKESPAEAGLFHRDAAAIRSGTAPRRRTGWPSRRTGRRYGCRRLR